MSFVHLHCHSQFSFLSGVDTAAGLLEEAKQQGMKALALTDTNGLYAAVPFYKKARECGIRPIFGAELDDGGAKALILAKNREGFAELCRLITARHLEEEFQLSAYLSRPPWRQEKGLSPDIFICTASPALLETLASCNHHGTLQAEIVRRPGMQRLSAERRLLALAHRLKVPPVATNAVYFIRPERHALHRLLTAIRQKAALASLPRDRTASREQWLKPEPVMRRLFADLPEALARTGQMAEACHVDLETGRPLFPLFPLPRGETPFSHLWKLCFRGMVRRYRTISPPLVSRLQYELETIGSLGFSPYFLIVQDIVRFAREKKIPTVGRGSAADSLVSYVLEITDVDPVKYDLYFERFLNAGRSDPPDIDIDLCWKRREKVLRYVYEKYGHDRVAMICTYNTFSARGAFRDVARVLGLDPAEISKITSRLPYFARAGSLDRAPERVPECRDLPFRQEPYRSIVRMAAEIDGYPRHLSIHCGGIVISPFSLTDLVPLERSSNGLVITQYDMYPLEDLGLVKIDLLGQRGLSVVADTVEAVRENYGEAVDFSRFEPEEDSKTRELVRRGETLGCFYIESPAMRSLLKKLRVDSFPLLVAASSIIRPGVSNSGMMRKFIDRHNGKEEVRYLHPLLEDLLKETYGIMIYQEDVIKVAHHLAGMGLAEADALRRCMSKKRNWEAMEKYRGRFIRGCRQHGVCPEVADALWEQIECFAGYAFCKAHSASFARISYQAAYLRARYPAEFMASVLTNQGGFYGTSVYLEEARRMGLRPLPPHINRSREGYTAERVSPSWENGNRRNGVRVGLMQIKHLGRDTVRSILEQRSRGGLFLSFQDFCSRAGASFREIETLVRCGALDCLGANRPELLWKLGLLRRRKEKVDADALFSKEPDAPPLPDYAPLEKLKDETEILELAVSAPPLGFFRKQLSDLGAVASDALAGYVGRHVRVAGRVVTSKRTQTKQGETMKFLTLEDLHGLMEVTLFPGVYRRYGHLLPAELPLVVEGKVEEDCGSLSITALKLEHLKI